MEIKFKNIKVTNQEIKFLADVSASIVNLETDWTRKDMKSSFREKIVEKLTEEFIKSDKFNELLKSIDVNELKNLTMLNIQRQIR